MKLDEFTKGKRKFLINHFGKSLKLRTFNRVTFAFIKTSSNRGKIAWSIHSESDGKFRRKYGEYVALERLYNSGMPIEFDQNAIEYIDCWLQDFRDVILLLD